MSRYGMPVSSSQATVSATATAWPQFTHRRCVMIRIQTPASDRRHRLSDTPGIAGMWRNIRCSSTARRCSRSNSSAESTPHSEKSQERSSASDAGSTSRSAATTARNAAV